MNKLNLILHCGGSAATREQILAVKTPRATESWVPIGHGALLKNVEDELNLRNMRIVNESFGLAHEGKRMFGVLQIANGTNSNDYSWVAGIRNSMDKSFPAAMCCGSGVFVCDNLAFSSEIKFGRRHTTFINRDLPLKVATSIGDLAAKWDTQGKRIDSYKNTEVSRSQAADLIITAMSEDVFPKTKIEEIWSEWLKPRHPEFNDCNVWSLFNAVTEHLKPRSESKGHTLWELPARTSRLHSLCDAACGIDLGDLKPATN